MTIPKDEREAAARVKAHELMGIPPDSECGPYVKNASGWTWNHSSLCRAIVAHLLAADSREAELRAEVERLDALQQDYYSEWQHAVDRLAVAIDEAGTLRETVAQLTRERDGEAAVARARLMEAAQLTREVERYRAMADGWLERLNVSEMALAEERTLSQHVGRERDAARPTVSTLREALEEAWELWNQGRGIDLGNVIRAALDQDRALAAPTEGP